MKVFCYILKLPLGLMCQLKVNCLVDLSPFSLPSHQCPGTSAACITAPFSTLSVMACKENCPPLHHKYWHDVEVASIHVMNTEVTGALPFFFSNYLQLPWSFSCVCNSWSRHSQILIRCKGSYPPLHHVRLRCLGVAPFRSCTQRVWNCPLSLCFFTTILRVSCVCNS